MLTYRRVGEDIRPGLGLGLRLGQACGTWFGVTCSCSVLSLKFKCCAVLFSTLSVTVTRASM